MAPKLIAIYAGKGGVGKTTLATNLAFALAATNKVGLADVDYQESTTRLGNQLKVPCPYRMVRADDGSGVDDLEYLIADMPPSIKEARPMLESARLIVVPFTLRELDVQALTRTLMTDLAGMPRVVVMNRITHAQRSTQTVVRNVLTGLDLNIIPTVIREYVNAHDRANRVGIPIMHPDAKGSKIEEARADMHGATSEIHSLIGAM